MLVLSVEGHEGRKLGSGFKEHQDVTSIESQRCTAGVSMSLHLMGLLEEVEDGGSERSTHIGHLGSGEHLVHVASQVLEGSHVFFSLTRCGINEMSCRMKRPMEDLGSGCALRPDALLPTPVGSLKLLQA